MTNIVIVGAGIIGSTTAYMLARRGLKVTIIDREDEGQATNAAAGIICPWLTQRRNKAWYELAKNGARLYPKLIELLKEDGEVETGYKKVGALDLYNDREKLQTTYNRVMNRKNEAPEIGTVSRLDEEETKKILPLTHEHTYRAVYISGAARVDGHALRKALINGATKHGATFIKGNAQLTVEGKVVTGVTVNYQKIRTDLVIATNGAWMNELLQPLGINFSVHPQKGQIIHLRAPINTHQWPIVKPPNNQYILPFEQNRLIIGATNEKKAKFNSHITAGGISDILTKALKVIPMLYDSKIEHVKVGFRPFTPQSHPVIGFLPNTKSILLANGLGASGLTTGPYVGIQLANIVLGETYDIDLSLYDTSYALLNKDESND